MSAHGKNTKDSIGQRTSSKSTSMNVEESKVTSDKQSSQSYTNASDTTVGLPLALEDKLKKSLPGFGIEQSVKAFFVHSLYGTTLPNHFEVSKDELVLMASIVDEKILDMGKKEGKVLKTSDGQSVTMDELLGWRKQGGRSPEVMKMLYDKQIQLEEKDVELKQLKADLEEKRRLAEEQAVMTSNVKAKVEILKETIGNLEEENMCICKKYDSEKNMFETETRNLKSVINDKTTMIQQFEMQMELYNLDYNELQKKLKASEERFELQRENFKQYINELHEKLKASEKKCQNLSGQVKREQKTNEFMKADHEDEIRKINSQIKDLIAERDDLKHRFRKLAGDKLTDQNPDIADLSDPYRAMKLSDKFGELYDDQWTDAFEALQKTKKNTREAIDILLNALQRCEDFFKRLREDQMDSLTNILLYPSQNISKIGTDARKRVGGLKEHERITSADKKAMRELRRQVGVSDGVLEEVKQIFIMETKSWDEKKLLESCIPYLQKCAELCWLMVTHDPPLYMKIDVKQGDPMDLNIYTRYSSNGSFIDFLVWPALFNEKDGGLLSKGTAEPLGRVKKK